MTITKADLSQFCGTENYYRPLHPTLVYTDGLKFLAEKTGCYWLIDLINQKQRLHKFRAEEFQVWKIHANGSQARVTCDNGSKRIPDDYLFDKTIASDFPANLSGLKLFCEIGSLDGVNEVMVLMLPSER